MKRILLCRVLLLILLMGCEATQSTPETINQAIDRLEGLAKSGNVAGTIHLDLEASGEVWQSIKFGIGNPHSRLRADLQYKFNESATTQPAAE